ncbi:MAG: AAA domain-containing protein [Sphingobacterium sp.]|uniref:AAA domain-containing protein n=1 Tax=Sphingobacterium sp. JB170 TaxID=1434842 RepID=UPI00097EE42C|nr:AAA domain-containing protein [Sphingobacterium sp. JB170]SJN44670.1 putative helicase [Sphingobacterium sp. JB170]
MEYFEELTSLLDQEQHYDRAQYETLLLKSSLQERRAQGMTWFPISIGESELGRGDYLTISVNKVNNLQEGDKFRFGMPVSLFSNHDPEYDRIDGIIAFVRGNTMRISFRVDELPDWSRRGKLGVDLLFDENAYREMHDALRKAKELKSAGQQGALIRQLVGEQVLPAAALQQELNYTNENCNASQNSAIQHILSERPLSILHGPPGTGKTTTLIKGIAALLKQEKRQILVVAPSNIAVDVLTERLDAAGLSVVRIGNPVKVSSHLQELTLDAQMETHRANKEAKDLSKQARAYTEIAHKYKRSFGKNEREQRKALFDEAHKLRKEIERVQDYILQDILDHVQVVTATLVGANHFTIRDRTYATVVIDEAAQALEPACWIPILKASKLVLAGDHLQLPPTVKSHHNMYEGLNNTLFEKLVRKYPAEVSLLDMQYRMHEQIMQYPSQALYQGKLQAASTVAGWTLLQDSAPIEFIDTAGSGFEETQLDSAIFNVEEAAFLRKHLSQTIASLAAAYHEKPFPSIGVIAPYRRQAAFLKEIITEDEQLRPFAAFIQINTIDSFQGQEKDVIYISLTRSNSGQQIGFLSDVRRMNVAMTRAKKKLIIIGDSSTIGQHPFYQGLLSFAESTAQYRSIWEWV